MSSEVFFTKFLLVLGIFVFVAVAIAVAVMIMNCYWIQLPKFVQKAAECSLIIDFLDFQ